MTTDNDKNSGAQQRALSGIKILDLSAVVSGPMAAAVLLIRADGGTRYHRCTARERKGELVGST